MWQRTKSGLWVDLESGAGSATDEVFVDQEQILSGIFASPTVGIGVIDDKLRYRSLNNAVARMDCVPVEAHLGAEMREVIGDPLAAKLQPAFEQVFVTGQPVLHFETAGKLLYAPGPNHYILSIFPLKDSGKVRRVGFVLLDRDRRQTDRPTSDSELEPWHTAASSRSERRAQSGAATEILHSWKEIAQHLAASVRTVQRWEREYNLPVSRLQTKKGSTVFAFKPDLEHWLRGAAQKGAAIDTHLRKKAS